MNFEEGYFSEEENDYPVFARSIPDPYKEAAYSAASAAATAAAAGYAANKAANEAFDTKSHKKAAKSAKMARRFATRTKTTLKKIKSLFKKLPAQKMSNLDNMTIKAAATAAREAELAARLAEEEAERKRALENEFNAYKKSINNAFNNYHSGRLRKKFLLLKIHPNKTGEIRKKFGNAKSKYFNDLNHDVKTLK